MNSTFGKDIQNPEPILKDEPETSVTYSDAGTENLHKRTNGTSGSTNWITKSSML